MNMDNGVKRWEANVIHINMQVMLFSCRATMLNDAQWYKSKYKKVGVCTTEIWNTRSNVAIWGSLAERNVNGIKKTAYQISEHSLEWCSSRVGLYQTYLVHWQQTHGHQPRQPVSLLGVLSTSLQLIESRKRSLPQHHCNISTAASLSSFKWMLHSVASELSSYKTMSSGVCK